MVDRPDVLVLGGGGVLGVAWLSGVLAGIEDAAAIDFRRCEHFVGTSAGSIVAARLSAGLELERPPLPAEAAAEPPAPEPPPSPSLGEVGVLLAERTATLALGLSTPFVPAALTLSAPVGALARAALLQTGMRSGGSLGALASDIDATGVEFDGRLRVVAVARASGRRVVFGSPGAPAVDVGAAVEASCTVPWLFAPARIGGVDYVDGGVWSPTNLDVAPAGRDTQVLCLNPTAGLSGRTRVVAAARSLSRSATAIEAAALRARRAKVTLVAPDAGSSAAIGTDLMATAPRAGVLAAGYRQGVELARSENSGGGPRRRGLHATTPRAGVRSPTER
jgi:NTE family protein